MPRGVGENHNNPRAMPYLNDFLSQRQRNSNLDFRWTEFLLDELIFEEQKSLTLKLNYNFLKLHYLLAVVINGDATMLNCDLLCHVYMQAMRN